MVGFAIVVLSACLLSLYHNYETICLLELSSSFATGLLLVIGTSLVILPRYLRFFTRPGVDGSENHEEIELETHDGHHASRFLLPIKVDYRRTVPVLAAVVAIRLELLRYVRRHAECSIWGPEVALPLVSTAFLYFLPEFITPVSGTSNPSSMLRTAVRSLQSLSPRQLLSAAMVSGGSYQLLIQFEPPNSTYICFYGRYNWTVRAHLLGVLLDALLLHVVAQMITSSRAGNDKERIRYLRVIGVALWGAALISLLADLARLYREGFHFEALHHTVDTFRWFNETLVLFLMTYLCLYCLQFIHSVHLSQFFVVVLSVSGSLPLVVGSHVIRPTTSFWALVFGWAAVLLGMYIFRYPPASAESKSSKSSPLTQYIPLFAILTLVPVTILAAYRESIHFSEHPIAQLQSQAQTTHDSWLRDASASKSLEDAVASYRSRYNMFPPPGFDKWYEYATGRNSTVVDNYDSIYNNLLPFWSVSPEKLRARTRLVASDAANDISLLRIRNGEVDLGPDDRPTHRWMMDGVKSLLEPFVQNLPDMDLAFNINDECRVALRWEDMQQTLENARTLVPSTGEPDNSWTGQRASQWEAAPEKDTIDYTVDGTPKESTIDFSMDRSSPSSYSEFTAQTCPPDSMARKRQVVNHHKLCLSCINAHSLGPFVSNWTLAGDYCHQPDLAYLHGYIMSPAVFKVTRSLVPIFSQSKISGYNDILYPSAWNYIDKAKYDPSDNQPDIPFPEKRTTLFWRGATSEGLSKKGEWRGMTRQRLVWLADATHSLDSNAVLLPDRNPSDWALASHDGIRNYRPSMDVSIVDHVDRCENRDCGEQDRAFHFSGRVDFQEHWQYKYLFDLDGAAFSGRFLPFLQSHSLPIKTALFREWFDDRITAWLHFVPQDIRLHGLYSTLIYYAGLDTTRSGRPVHVDAHDAEAARIAENGREWAGRALRKEDMEIYMYRLLLEWGRLTDDRRRLIGYTV